MTFADLAEQIGYAFEDESLLVRALTHRSWSEEGEPGDHNERLEYLGDAVLELMVTEMLYNRFPDATEGDLSRARAALVRTDSLAVVGRQLDLGKLLRLGRGEEKTGGRTKPKLLADAFEAILGAMYLEGGVEPCRELVQQAFSDRLGDAVVLDKLDIIDPRSRLQELTMAKHKRMPLYERVSMDGPPHERIFVYRVVVEGVVTAEGAGSSKQRAKTAAARAALEAMPPEPEQDA